MNELSSALDILGAMITPAVLILACGSLILSTSNRLTRVIDRVREVAELIEKVDEDPKPEEYRRERRLMLIDLLGKAVERVRLSQKAITRLYLALSCFVGTSMVIGLVALADSHYAWTALIFGFIGSGLLLYASFILILESRLGLAAAYVEMDFISRHHVKGKIEGKRPGELQ